MIEINKLLHKKMRSFGAATYEKFLCSEIERDWGNLVDDSIAEDIQPITLKRGVLFVAVIGSAHKDQLKFFAEEIIDAINENFGQGKTLVKEVRPAKASQIAKYLSEKISQSAQTEEPKLTPKQITLSEEEIARCREQSKKISDEKLRQTVFETLMSQARLQKFRLASGWHKCARCDTLCPPEENFCETCHIKERAAMVDELFKIFYDEPWLKPHEAQKILLDKMPHMRRDCPLDVVESARTSLIQKVAGKIRFGDEESPDVMKLVMLEKRLPPEKITPAIIRRTLIDLQFNLADNAQLQRYNAKKKSPRK